MNSKTVIVAAVVAAGMLAGGAAWREVRARLEVSHALEVAARRKADAAAEVKRMETRLEAVEKTRAELQFSLEELRKGTLNTVTPKTAGSSMAPADQMDLMRQDPKLQNLFIVAQRAALATQYNVFFRKTRLSPEQIEQFDAIMIRRTEQNLDIDAVARSRGFAVDSAESTVLRRQADSEMEAAQAALLGPAGSEEFQQYQRAMGPRIVMGNFVSAAALEGMALSSEQTEQMIQVLANASASYRNGGKAAFGNLEDINWDAVDHQAREILSEEQMNLYRRLGLRTTVSDWFVSVFNEAIKADQASAPGVIAKPGSVR